MIGLFGRIAFKVAFKKALAYAAGATIAAAGVGAVNVAVHKANAEIDKKNENEGSNATQERMNNAGEVAIDALNQPIGL